MAGAHRRQLQNRARLGSPFHLALHPHEQLHGAHQLLPVGATGLLPEALRILGGDLQDAVQLIPGHRRQQHAPQVVRRVQREHPRVAAPAHRVVDHAQRRCRVVGDQRVRKFKHEVPARGAQHVPGQLRRDRALGKGQAHVHKAQCIAHRALRRPGNLQQGLRFGAAADALQHHLKAGNDGLHPDAVEVEALAAGEDRGRELLWLGGGQDEHGVLRRLLQGLEQRVERAGGEHVHLVDDVDLVAPHGGRILDLLAQVANLVHAVVGGRVDLHHVQVVLPRQLAAGLAFAAGLAVLVVQAVDRPGQHLGGTGLAGAAAAAEQVGVRYAAAGDLVDQRGHDPVLTHDVGKALRPPLAIQRLIAHARTPPLRF